MNGKDIDLGSVNWAQGMLLTPEHFLRQEKYFDSALLWAIHFAMDGYGLVGSGGRAEPADRGTARHNPVTNVDEDGYDDPANPQIKSTRRQRYRLKLDVTAAEAAHSLMISRLRKAEGGLRYERAPGFIPVCTTLIGHSELKRAWERLRDQTISLSERYLQLHKAIVEYIAIAAGSYIPTGADNEVLEFVGRMVTTLESSVYDALDPLQ